jgi:hypothetical protein
VYYSTQQAKRGLVLVQVAKQARYHPASEAWVGAAEQEIPMTIKTKPSVPLRTRASQLDRARRASPITSEIRILPGNYERGRAWATLAPRNLALVG